MNERVDSIDEEGRENVRKRTWEFGHLASVYAMCVSILLPCELII